MLGSTFIKEMNCLGLTVSDRFIVILGSGDRLTQIEGYLNRLLPEASIAGNLILEMKITSVSPAIPQATSYVAIISVSHLISIAKCC